MKNKLRAGMGVKNPMIMVDPDKAKEKFEKMATSITASTGEEEEKEGACESVDHISEMDRNMSGLGLGAKVIGGALDLAKKGITKGITSAQQVSKLGQKLAVSAGGLGTAIGAAKLVTPSKKPNMPGSGAKQNYMSTMKNSYDLEMSDISKTIMERGLTHSGQGSKLKNNTSDVGDKGSVGSSGSNTDTKIPTNTTTDTKIPDKGDTPSTQSTGDIPSTPSTPSLKTDILKKDKVKQIQRDVSVNSSYDPISNKDILGISEKILKKNFNLGEEGYDIARDEGRVKPSKDKKDATTMPPSKEMEKTRKKYKGPSALEIVKKKYKGQIMDVDKKKKDKK